nr:hypothetical protein [Edwardsiella ictaluri]
MLSVHQRGVQAQASTPCPAAAADLSAFVEGDPHSALQWPIGLDDLLLHVAYGAGQEE